jgi:hypothetical protein
MAAGEMTASISLFLPMQLEALVRGYVRAVDRPKRHLRHS